MPIKEDAIQSTRWTRTVVFAVLTSIMLTAQPLLCTAKSTGNQLFSLDVRKQPLGEVLKKISNDTGYRIMVDPEWTGFLVCGSFKNLPIDQGLRRILADLNHSIIFNDADQRISIVIKSPPPVERFQETGIVKADSSIPTGPSNSQTSKNLINSDEIQVIPPKESGEAGITLKQLKETEAGRGKIETEEIEVIPPSEGASKGITLKEIKTQKIPQQAIQANEDIEVIPPPSGSADKGVTLREIKTRQVPQPMGGIEDTNPVPPDSKKRNLNP